jgi:hypothetical protein
MFKRLGGKTVDWGEDIGDKVLGRGAGTEAYQTCQHMPCLDVNSLGS